jgi:hypothetical protein
MGTHATLEKMVLEDTMFGDPKVRPIEVGEEPDTLCGCKCSCLGSQDRAANSQLSYVIATAGIPIP